MYVLCMFHVFYVCFMCMVTSGTGYVVLLSNGETVSTHKSISNFVASIIQLVVMHWGGYFSEYEPMSDNIVLRTGP